MRAAAGRLDQIGRETGRIVEQRLEHVLGRELLVAGLEGQRLGALDNGLGAVCVFIEFHVDPPKKAR